MSDFIDNIEDAAPDSAEVEFRSGDYGFFARVTNIDTDEHSELQNDVLTFGYSAATIESGDGLGIEIWTN